MSRWLVACDESGIHGARFYGYGSLWLPWDRRGDFSADIRELRRRHGHRGEFKWNKAHSKRFASFYADVVELFFQRRWLAFHCIVIRKGLVDLSYHDGDVDLARRKHFTIFLANKIERAMAARAATPPTFRIWVDPIPSRVAKADEIIGVVGNHILQRQTGSEPIESVRTRDSRSTPSIQLCDLLLGAVMDAWQGKATSAFKTAVQRRIAMHLGWPDLNADTFPDERKFNIWYYNEQGQVREAKTRPVELMYSTGLAASRARTA